MSKIKSFVSAQKRKLLLAAFPVATALMTVVPTFAAEAIAADGTIDPAMFDPLVTGITSNIGTVMPKVIVLLGIIIGISFTIAMVKKHARPN